MLLSQGLSYARIAEMMRLSEHTVVSYARVVFDKLNLNGRERLVRELLAPPAATPNALAQPQRWAESRIG